MTQITFRSSRIVYYGPHPCARCGVLICKMGNEWGDSEFAYPEGPIYPNTEWHVHVCDPHLIYELKGREAKILVLKLHASAHAEQDAQGWRIWDSDLKCNLLSRNMTWHHVEAGAWQGALENMGKSSLV